MGVDATLKRYLPAIITVMIAIIAYFQAVGICQIVSMAIMSDEAPSRAPRAPKRHRPAADPDHATSAAAILARNPFDSTTGPLHEQPAPAPQAPSDGAPASERNPYDDPPCAGVRAVLIAGSSDPEWSFAALQGSDGKVVLRRRGEEIDKQKVYFVGDQRPADQHRGSEGGVWDRVWLTTAGGGHCQITLGAPPPGARPPGATPPPASFAPSSSVAGKIRQISETQFEVDRSAVEQTIANPAELMKARIFPVRDGERVVGMRLMGVRPGTLLGSLGMQNGDVLTAINGFEMNDPQRMLEAYSKLMKADNLTATVVRGGRPVNIEFHIK